MLLGGPVIGGGALSRFFALHVFVIPGALLALLAVHLWLVLKCGVSAPPVPGRNGRSANLRRRVRTGTEARACRSWATRCSRTSLFSALAVIAVVLIAAIVGPKGPTGPPDPTLRGANPRPEWPFLWLFALLSLSPPERGDVHHPRVSGDADAGPVGGAVR